MILVCSEPNSKNSNFKNEKMNENGEIKNNNNSEDSNKEYNLIMKNCGIINCNKNEIIKLSKESKESKGCKESIGSIPSSKNDNNLFESKVHINTNANNNRFRNAKNEDQSESLGISSDNELNLSFHDEQLPVNVKD